MLQLSFKSILYCQAISYTLHDTATQTEICTVSGVMSQELRTELLLLPPPPEQKRQMVPVLNITWLHTNPLFAGFRYGACLMYLLALFAQKQYHAQYIVLDDTTDVPPPCNLFHLMGFKHRARLEVGGDEFWQTWCCNSEHQQPCIGPERLAEMDAFMTCRFTRRKIQPKLKTLLSLVSLNYTIDN
jgi:hypothetical protein